MRVISRRKVGMRWGIDSPPQRVAPKGYLIILISLRKFWSGRGDSNARPQPWQNCVIPFLGYARARYTTQYLIVL